MPTRHHLLGEVAATLAPDLPAVLDLSLAHGLLDDRLGEIDWSLFGLLAPLQRNPR